MRGLRIVLVACGLLLLAIFYISDIKTLFFSVSLFTLVGIAALFVEYRESVGSLRRELWLSLEKDESEKEKLCTEMKKTDDYISELRNKEIMIASLYEITKKMSQELTFAAIFEVLSAFLKENFAFRKSELLILKDEDGRAKVDKVYAVYKGEKPKDEDTRDDRKNILDLFSADKKEVYITKEGQETFAAIPLLSENKFVGVLTIENLPQPDFDRFAIVAMQFALEMKKVLLYETVEELAIRDSLTGLYTRRYFFERLTEELNRSKRHGFKFSFVMFDIDDFKHCNDTHGHLVGDVVLRDIARITKSSVREIDLLARYGGEEFSLILPETDKAGAILVAERIRKRVEENVFKAYDETLKVTISAGVSAYPDDSEEAADIVEKADKALYAAKSAGKNIVCEYKP